MQSITLATKNSLGDIMPHYVPFDGCPTFDDFKIRVVEYLKDKTCDYIEDLELCVRNNHVVKSNEFKKPIDYSTHYTYMDVNVYDEMVITDDIKNILVITDHGNIYIEQYKISCEGFDLAPGLNELGYNLIGKPNRIFNRKNISQEILDQYSKYVVYFFEAKVTPRFHNTKSARNYA